MASIFKDREFQLILLRFVCRDRLFMKDAGSLLDQDDFRPSSKKESNDLWLLAGWALDYYKDRGEPIGGLLRPWVIDKSDEMKLGDKRTGKLLDVVREIQSVSKDVISVDAVQERIVRFKKSRLKERAIEKIISTMEEKGEVSDDEWLSIANEAVKNFGHGGYEISDPFLDEEIERRIRRREDEKLVSKYPYLFLDWFDEKYRSICRGQVGMVLAMTKGGKSLALLHLAVAYACQNLRVLFFTLEDPKPIVEDRLDASLTRIRMRDLVDLPNRFRKRFKRMRQLIHARIRIIDGTSESMTLERMEEIYQKERNRGFVADAILVDYDDEIIPPKKYKDASGRRFEFSDIYRGFRKMQARLQTLGWLAAQTNIKAEGRKIITMGMNSEDMSKIRKVSLCLGIGEGDWGEDSKYINVVASKNDRMRVGSNICTDYECGLFYDREATLKRASRRKENGD